MSEQLLQCPMCLQPNFTRRGLRSHWCPSKAVGKRKSAPLDKDEWQAIVDGRWAEFTRERAAAVEIPDTLPSPSASADSSREHASQSAPGNLSKIARKERDAVALSAMEVGQLEESHVMLNTMAGHHDGANTACCLLDGLVLTELKRRLGHGKWGTWLKRNYGKSQDTATNRMRAAGDFLMKLQDPKCRSTSEFDLQAGVDVLKQDLSTTLAVLETAKLDLAHPLVRAASVYAGGRSFYQLCLDLGPASRGGDTSKSTPTVKKSRAEIAREEAQIFFLPLQQKLFEALQSKAKSRLRVLPVTASNKEASLSILRDVHRAFGDLLDAALAEKGRQP
jgi:hypothetical protein